MSNGHTPGDWHVSELDATGEKSKYYIFIEPGVAVIERSVTGEHDMNDARLISAAPDLLEALEMIVAEADSYTARTGKPVYNWLDQARAAIAKARGTPC